MTMSPSNWFSNSYVGARERFQSLARKKGGVLSSIPLTVNGPKDESLTIDLARFGAEKPNRVLLHTSGLHGIEGFAGSAIQLSCMEEDDFTLNEGDAIIFAHVLNPYGMAWHRRVNENNVDLNRNFLPAGRPYRGASDGYRTMNGVLNPSSPPGFDFFLMRAGAKILRYGYTTLKQAITEGQYAFEHGLFFGGRQLEEGPRLYTQWIENNLSCAQEVFVIDVHTGLGESGVDTLLVDLQADHPDYLHLKTIFGERVAGWDAGTSVAYEIHGGHPSVLPRILPGTKVNFLTQEFGTIAPLKVLHALREENRWHHHGAAHLNHPTKTNIMHAFCPRSKSWDGKIIQRGATVYAEAKAELFS